MKNIKEKTNHTDERERKVIQMKKLLALIFTFAILVSVTGIAAALVDPETGVDYPEEGYITYSVEYSPEKAQELLDEVNAFRRSNAWYYGSDGSIKYAGVLDDLILDDSLTEAAMYRAAQQAVKASHTQPGGGSGCYNIHKDVVAENIDFGSETAHQAFTGLAEEQCTYNGQGHRRSMLSNATHVGVGCATINGVTYWVIEYAYGEPTHKANTMMTEDTVTTLVNTNVVNTDRKKVVLKASASSVTCKVGETVTLPTPNVIIDFGREPYIENLTTTPVDVTWVSNDGSVATVSGGSVTGVKEGRTSATASYFGQTVNVSVIVEPAETTKACTHSNVSERVVTNATCTADGKKEKYCMECGEVIETITLPKTGHSISERITKEATHTAEGTKEKYCTVCGDVTEIIATPKATDHTVGERVVTNATCTADGKKEKYCMECGEVIETITLPKTGHSIAERVTKEATHTAEGTKEKYCTVCGTVTETIAIPKTTGHNVAERVVTNATCTADGAKEKYCTECGEVLESITLPQTGHTLAERVTKEASHTAEGMKETYCTVCGTVTESIGIPKTTGHNVAERVVTDATCSADGAKEKYCTECGEVLETITIPKTDHALAERVAKEATVTSEGTKDTYCTVCGSVISTSAIPKKACDHSRIHEYSEPEATCINEGKRYKQCLECYASLGCDTIPKTDHNLAKRVTKEATATSEGIIETYCTVCGVVTATEPIPKTACTHERTTETVTLEPKCWREGTKDICCADCGAFIRTEKIKKVAHQWSPTYDPAYTQDNGDKGFPCLEENCNAVLMRFANECD